MWVAVMYYHKICLRVIDSDQVSNCLLSGYKLDMILWGKPPCVNSFIQIIIIYHCDWGPVFHSLPLLASLLCLHSLWSFSLLPLLQTALCLVQLVPVSIPTFLPAAYHHAEGSSKLLCSVSLYPPVYMVQHARRQPSSRYLLVVWKLMAEHRIHRSQLLDYTCHCIWWYLLQFFSVTRLLCHAESCSYLSWYYSYIHWSKFWCCRATIYFSMRRGSTSFVSYSLSPLLWVERLVNTWCHSFKIVSQLKVHGCCMSCPFLCCLLGLSWCY